MDWAPSAIEYGEVFDVDVPDPDAIGKVSFTRLGMVTHAFDQNQRFMWLPFARSGDHITVQGPSDNNIAPPGAWALWLLSNEGVPSLANYVILGGELDDPGPPIAPGAVNLSQGATATASSTQDASHTPDLAIDGDVGSRWRPDAGTTGNEWLELDLGAPAIFDTVVIDASGVGAFRLQYHDGAGWVDILTGTSPGGHNFDPVTASRVRLLIETVAGGAGVSVWEFDVWSVPLNCTIDPGPATGVGSEAFFIGQVTGAIGTLTHEWEFGDGDTSAGEVASHIYDTAANYRVTLRVEDGPRGAICNRTQVIHNPLTASRPTRTTSIAWIGQAGLAVAVNPDNDTASAVSPQGAKVWESDVGDNPSSVAAGPNGEAWVVNRESATISVLDGASGGLIDTIDLPHGTRPYGIVFAPDGNTAYVTLEGVGQLLELDASGALTGSVDVGPKPRGIAVSGDSSRVFVTRFLSSASEGQVTEVGAAGLTVTRVFSLAFDTSEDTELNGRGVPNYVNAVAISPDGLTASVPSKKDNTARGELRDGRALTFENTVRAITSQLDLVSNVENGAARVDMDDANLPLAATYNEFGNQLFVALLGSNRVEVRDAYDPDLVLTTIGGAVHAHGEGGGHDHKLAPLGLTFNGNFQMLFVHNFLSRNVEVYHLPGFGDGSDYTAHLMHSVDTVANEALAANVLHGKRIFYNSNDTRMSLDGYISCASCHLDGMADERVWDFTDRGEGFRNTISLFGRRGIGHGRVHWTANFDEIQDFENDIRNAFAGTGFMTDADFNAGTRSDPLGDPKTGLSSDLDALAAYAASLSEVHASPHRNGDGTLTADAEAGKVLFEGAADCASCHIGPDFTDTQIHDVGTLQPHSGEGSHQPLTGIDTPTLLGIWETAPYLHDGSVATFADVIANPVHGAGSTLTATEQGQLVDFLLQLSRSDGSGGGSGEAETILIEAEDYDRYADWNEGNQCGAYRTDDVDIQNSREGGFHICRIRADEWLEFDVDVLGDGIYDLTARVSNKGSTDAAYHVEIDGVDVTGSVAVPVTGGFQTWIELTSTGVPILPGTHVLTIYMDGNRFTFDRLEISNEP